jgi:hypothetical protein
LDATPAFERDASRVAAFFFSPTQSANCAARASKVKRGMSPHAQDLHTSGYTR